MKKLFCILLMLCAFPLVRAQITVKGTVTDRQSGEAAIGVAVAIRGTTLGTVTDLDGAYELTQVPAEATLVFSYIGWKTLEIPLGGRKVVNVQMEEDTQHLEEVVVIGYGTSKARDLTAPIAVVKADELVKHATTSPMAALQGKVAGVQIVSNGQPGSGPDVRIRGIGSFDDKTKPLYVVDGMFFDNIDFLNNNDIQDLSVLKDASAASIYGVRAANGVIIVTTQKGTLGRPATVTYDGYVGFQKATNRLKMANSAQYARMQLEKANATDSSIIRNSIQAFGGDMNTLTPGADTDWYKELLRTALIHNHSLDVSGGTEKVAYSVGVNYLYQEGIMDAKNDYERFNLRTKADYNALGWLKVGANIVISNATQHEPDNTAWRTAYQVPGIFPVMDERRSDTDVYPVKYASANQVGLSSYDYFNNPVALAHFNDKKNKQLQVLPSFYAEASLLPGNKLTFRTAYSQDISIRQGRTYKPVYKVGGSQERTVSELTKANEFFHNYIWDNTLTYRDRFGKHNLTAMAGHSLRREYWQQLQGISPGVPGGEEAYLYLSQGNAAGRQVDDDGTSYYGLSYFGRVAYDYAGKYLLSATMRADGSSKYQEKWGYFPSVGAAWIVSEEGFMKNQKVFDFLKLRASWGKLGNDKIQASDGFASISQDLWTSGVSGSTVLPGYTHMAYFSWLAWEVVNEWNVGAELSVFHSRLGVEVDYYCRLTENAVIDAPLPMGAGSLLGNNGEVLNSGLELSFRWSDRIGKDFSYSIGANLTTLKNEVKNLNGLPYIYGGSDEFRTISRVGDSMNAFYGYEIEGVYQNAAEIAADPVAVENSLSPGDFKYTDQNRDGKIDEEDRVILGSYLPDITYGVNLGFSYKHFDFSMVMQGQAGNQICNRKRGERRWQSDINYDADLVENRWTGEGSTDRYPSAAGTVNPWNIAKFNSFYVEDGSYFRIQNVQVAYTFARRQLRSFHFPAIRVSLSAERPYTCFKSNGFTPEVRDGFDLQTYPLAATYTLGLRITY